MRKRNEPGDAVDGPDEEDPVEKPLLVPGAAAREG